MKYVFALLTGLVFFGGFGDIGVRAQCYPMQSTITQYQDFVNNVYGQYGITLHRLKNVTEYVDSINKQRGAEFRYPHSMYYFTNKKNNSIIVVWVDSGGCVAYKEGAELKSIVQFIKAKTEI